MFYFSNFIKKDELISLICIDSNEYILLLLFDQSQAHWASTNGPSGDKVQQKEDTCAASERQDATLGAHPPVIVLLDDFHLVGIFLESLS